jgi:hypothetical protein
MSISPVSPAEQLDFTVAAAPAPLRIAMSTARGTTSRAGFLRHHDAAAPPTPLSPSGDGDMTPEPRLVRSGGGWEGGSSRSTAVFSARSDGSMARGASSRGEGAASVYAASPSGGMAALPTALSYPTATVPAGAVRTSPRAAYGGGGAGGGGTWPRPAPIASVAPRGFGAATGDDGSGYAYVPAKAPGHSHAGAGTLHRTWNGEKALSPRVPTVVTPPGGGSSSGRGVGGGRVAAATSSVASTTRRPGVGVAIL